MLFLHTGSFLRAQSLEKGFSQRQLMPTAGQGLVEMDLTRGTLGEGVTQCATVCLPVSLFGEDWRGSYKMHFQVQIPGTLGDKWTFLSRLRQGKNPMEVQAYHPGGLSDSGMACSTLRWFSEPGFHSLTDSSAGLTGMLLSCLA